jgi:hypothetical protein
MKKSLDQTGGGAARQAPRAKPKPLPFRYGDEQGGFLVDAEHEHAVAPGGTPDSDAADRPDSSDDRMNPAKGSKL